MLRWKNALAFLKITIITLFFCWHLRQSCVWHSVQISLVTTIFTWNLPFHLFPLFCNFKMAHIEMQRQNSCSYFRSHLFEKQRYRYSLAHTFCGSDDSTLLVYSKAVFWWQKIVQARSLCSLICSDDSSPEYVQSVGLLANGVDELFVPDFAFGYYNVHFFEERKFKVAFSSGICLRRNGWTNRNDVHRLVRFADYKWKNQPK